MTQPKLVVCDHPLLKHKLAHLRDKRTTPSDFRRLMQEAGAILGYEAMRELACKKISVPTPIKTSPAEVLAGPVALVAVLRAGLGLMEGALTLYPEARIGHIGLYRNEETLNPVRYYVRLPKDLSKSFVILCDPMLATGGSAAEAVRILKMDGARKIVLISLLSAKDGIRRVHQDHPDVAIYTAAVDAKLNSVGYIVPGLGDAGDRLFGTY